MATRSACARTSVAGDDALRVRGDCETLEVERFVEAQVDLAGDAALDQIGGARLIDIGTRQRLGRKILIREAATGAGKDFAPVERGQDIAETADDRADDFVIVAHRDLDTGHALQCRRDGGIGELADVVGDDRVDDVIGSTLDIGRLAERSAKARDDDIVAIARRRRRLGRAIGGRRGLRLGRPARQQDRQRGRCIEQSRFRFHPWILPFPRHGACR
jgi:hypothetical protein